MHLTLLVIVYASLSSARLYVSPRVGITSSKPFCILSCTQHRACHIVGAPYTVLEWTDLLLIMAL